MTMLAQDALELAREAAIETAGDADAVGELLDDVRGEDVRTLVFACLLPGYRGWRWTVDVVELNGEVTVCESALLPGGDALLAPQWVPWSERVQPGDLEPGMILPFIAEDPRLVPGYTVTGDDVADAMAIFEFGLGRERVLAPEAVHAAARRWHRGSHGPNAAQAVAAGAVCSTCAFFVPLAGSMRLAFGACANEWSPSDGKVVAIDHGCGAHSQTDAERRASEWPAPDPLVDSGAVDAMDLNEPDPEPVVEDLASDTAEEVVGHADGAADDDATVPLALVEAEAEAQAEAEPEPEATTEELPVAELEDAAEEPPAV